MKKTFLPLLLLAAIPASSLLAQRQQPQGDSQPAETQPAHRENPNLMRRLALSRDQQAQWHAVNKDRKMQLDAVQSDPSLSPHARKEKIKEIHATSESKIRSMLNQNQQDEYDQIKRERHEQKMRQKATSTAAPSPTPQ